MNFKYAGAGLAILFIMAALDFSGAGNGLVRRFSPAYIINNPENFDGKEVFVFGLASEGEICSDNECIGIDYDLEGYYTARGIYHSGTNILSILRAEPESSSRLSFSVLGASIFLFALYWRVKNA